MNKKLYRDEYHKVIGGVCAGLAQYFEMDVTIVRLLFAFAFFVGGVGFIPYIILWIVLPKKGYLYNNFNNPTVDYTVPPRSDDQFTTPPAFGNNPYVNKPFSNNPYANSPYGSDPIMPPKQRSHAGIIVGMVLIFVGAAILIDEYDLIPDFDFGRLWPGILVLVGASLIVSGQRTNPFKNDWHKDEPKEVASTEVPETKDNTPTTI